MIVLNPILEARKAAKRERERTPEARAKTLRRGREWKRRNTDKTSKYKYAYRLRTKYSLTEEQHRQMLESQGCKCRICGKHNPNCVDHCHKTGAIRGLLCNHCNWGLGNFRDNPSLLNKAIEYLCNPSPPPMPNGCSPPAACGAPRGDGGGGPLVPRRPQ